MSGPRAKFTDNPHYLLYKRYLHRLHELIEGGLGDGEQADSLREAMDVPGRELSRSEVSRLNLISADLYALRGREHFSRGPGSELSPAERSEWVYQAWRQADWQGVIQRLRTGAVLLSPEHVHYLRAFAYRGLGELDISIEFMRKAHELDPPDATYCEFLLEALVEAGRPEEALDLARRYIGNSGASLEGRIIASGWCVHASQCLSDGERLEVLRFLAGHIAEMTAQPGFDKTEPFLQGLAYFLIGSYLDSLDKKAEAREAYTEALRRDPTNPGPLVTRGLAVVGDDPEAAAADFRQAIRLNVPVVTPYLFLAYDARKRGAYDECLGLCQRALRLGGSTQERAELHELRAVALSGLNRPPAEAGREFEAALKVDPLNPEIRENYAYFERQLAESPQAGLSWPHPLVFDPRRARVAPYDPRRLAALGVC